MSAELSPSRGATSSARRPWVVPAAVAAGLTVVLLAALVALDARAAVPRGVHIDGVDVGGRSREAAERAVTVHARERLDERILLIAPRATARTSGRALAARPRVAEAVADAGAERFGL